MSSNMMPRLHAHHRSQRGFTLVEIIVAMVLTTIIAGTLVLFIRRPVTSYLDSAGRAEMTDVADLALRRMAREIRASLPNSTRVNNVGGVVFLEFIPTYGGGRYLSLEDNTTTGTPLSFTNGAATSFSVVGANAAMAPGGPNYIAIYNLGAGFQDADAYAASNLARVTGSAIAASLQTISFSAVPATELGGGNAVSPLANPFAVPVNAATPRPPNTSPDQRFQVVGRPVIFRCQGNATGTGTLTRSVAASFSPVPSQPATAAGVLLANNVVACNISVGTNPNRQSALVGLTLTLGRTRPDSGLETVTLVHQIHVNNTP